MAYSNMFTHAQTAWPGFTPQYAQQMMALQHLMPLQGQPQAQDGLNPSTLHDAAQQITSLPPSSFYLPTPASVNPPSYLTNFATHPSVASTSTSPIAQGSLSPTASRPARSEPIHIPIPGSSTSSEPAPPLAPLKPTETPEERRAKLQAAIKPHIQANAFSGAPAVNKLIKVIDAFGLLDVDVAIRREVLGKIRDKAGNHYFRAWSENQDAMDVTREWLKAAIQNKDEDEEIVETIMPLLQVRNRHNRHPSHPNCDFGKC
jgi:protein phosphatase 1 regulatory subunit 10